MNQESAKGKTSAEGRRLVRRILDRRRAKCLQAQTHTTGRCRTCGVHQ